MRPESFILAREDSMNSYSSKTGISTNSGNSSPSPDLLQNCQPAHQLLRSPDAVPRYWGNPSNRANYLH